MDDPYVTCPYNRAHRVSRPRIQAHLVRCELRYPPLAICPYNATHRMSRKMLILHVPDCESRPQLPQERPPKVLASLTTPKPTLQRDYLPENDPENDFWDD